MKRLLIVYHSQTGRTDQLVSAVTRGARSDDVQGVKVWVVRAKVATAEHLLTADGLILATPENFGYMSGGMKDFFDRTFYAVEERIQSLPYALVVSAGNDGTGAVRAVERIVGGYPFRPVQEPVIVVGAPTEADRLRCEELGLSIAAGLELGVF
ncbi:MAG: NAD(P)H-dependent oxidoreductase [Pseudomonadota bacterium]